MPLKVKQQMGLYLADAIVLLGTLFATLIVRFGNSWPRSFTDYLSGFLIATCIHIAIYYFGELYEPLPRLGARALLPRVSGITGVAILVDASLALATGYYLMPRGNLILWGFIASIGITLNRRMKTFS